MENRTPNPLPDCVSAQSARTISDLRAAVSSKKAEIKRELEARLEKTIVEVPLSVLAELMQLATEAQESRERRARISAGIKRKLTAEPSAPYDPAAVDALIAEGQEARDRRTQRAAARKKLGSNASKSTTLPPAVLELARAGKSPKEIVAELGLPATYIGPIGARLKVARERGEL